jgi:hypothetical protein
MVQLVPIPGPDEELPDPPEAVVEGYAFAIAAGVADDPRPLGVN